MLREEHQFSVQCTVQPYTVYYSVGLYCSVKYSTVLYNTLLYKTVLCCNVEYSTALHCTVQYSEQLQYTSSLYHCNHLLVSRR